MAIFFSSVLPKSTAMLEQGCVCHHKLDFNQAHLTSDPAYFDYNLLRSDPVYFDKNLLSTKTLIFK